MNTTVDWVSDMANEYGWTFDLIANGRAVRFLWEEKFHDGRSFGYWGAFVDPVTGEKFTEWTADFTENMAKAAVRAFRWAQIRGEQSSPLYDSLARGVLVLEVFKRNRLGEYVGQGSKDQTLYVQDIAGLLDVDFRTARDLVESLVADGSLGLNGFILTSNEDFEKSFVYWREATGHHRLTVGDFGGWRCDACSQTGDEYDDPKDFPCVK